MSTMNKDEKRLMLFDMQEHPEKYTDEQVERLLADEEAQEFLRDLAMARMAGKKATPKKVDVDKAWKEFSEKHNKAKSNADCSLYHWHHLPLGRSLGCRAERLVQVRGF